MLSSVSYYHILSFSFFFFFQAEDGIRDPVVTGVQTCALPISWEAPGPIGACRSAPGPSSSARRCPRMRPGDSTGTGRESIGKRHGYEASSTCRERGGIAILKTKFTELVGCTVPIQQAGMGDLSPPRLAAAVADAGALGMVGLTSAPLSYVVKSLDEARHLTSAASGANFIYRGWVDE